MGRIGRWVRRLGASGERTAHHIDFLAPLDDDSFREAAQDLILTEVQLRLRHRASWCGIIIAAKGADGAATGSLAAKAGRIIIRPPMTPLAINADVTANPSAPLMRPPFDPVSLGRMPDGRL